VAVNVTGCPGADGLADDVTAVLVEACPTVCVRSADVLAVKLPSVA
jgi:hypothetical protein